jgi:CDP-paratose 2-epimerase
MKSKKVLITGGAGFIGSNLASSLITDGHQVMLFDDLSRPGVEHNLAWLKENHGDQFELVKADVCDFPTLLKAAEGAELVFHTAGQTAVTTSVNDPRQDFFVNSLGTFNVLEAARLAGDDPILIYTSTNKVYGGMEDVEIEELETRYYYRDVIAGIQETRPLDFHSPYGCSKGSADQYVRDYARIYGLKSVVFRMSSIYGPHQFGIEDQAWVAYFLIALVKDWPLTIYGDGKQVRDILYIDDLVRAFKLAVENIDVTRGEIYNIGGGYTNSISIWTEFSSIVDRLLPGKAKFSGFADWRPGDQLVYVSDTSKANRDFQWHPEFDIERGVKQTFDWIKNNQKLFTR